LPNIFRKWISTFVEFNKYHWPQTLLGFAMSNTTSEQWREMHDSSFNKAKRLSDFIAIIMRAGFVFLAANYFGRSMSKANAWWEEQALFFCWAASLGLYLALVIQTFSVISTFFLSDTAHWKSKWHKLAILILAVLLTLQAHYGIARIVRAVADAGALGV
jgi:hypothetical protein